MVAYLVGKKEASQIVGQIYFKSVLKAQISSNESTMYFLSTVLTKTWTDRKSLPSVPSALTVLECL